MSSLTKPAVGAVVISSLSTAQLSVADGAKVTSAPVAPVAVVVISATQVTSGAILSTTVIVGEHVLWLLLISVAVTWILLPPISEQPKVVVPILIESKPQLSVAETMVIS